MNELDRIEEWLDGLPTHPHIEYGQVRDASGALCRISPIVVTTVNKDALMSEWREIRALIK